MKLPTDKIQKYIFKRLLSGEPVFYETFSEGRILFSDGVRAFVLPEQQILFDCARFTKTDAIAKLLRSIYEPNEMKITNELFAGRRGELYRKLVPADGSEGAVWIEEKFVQDFTGGLFVYFGGTSPVCVKDDTGDLIAAIMPRDIDGSLRRRDWQEDGIHA